MRRTCTRFFEPRISLAMVLFVIGVLQGCGQPEGAPCGDNYYGDGPSACQFGLNCVDGFCGAPPSSGCRGEAGQIFNCGRATCPCEAPRSNDLGDPCGFDGNCLEGLYCLSDGEQSLCRLPQEGVAGSFCEVNLACRVGLHCNEAANVCVAPHSMDEGQPCEEPLDCQPGLVCGVHRGERFGTCVESTSR